MARIDREDLSQQIERLASARSDLADALLGLADEAKRAAKAASSKRGQPDILRVHSHVNAVRQAEEALDLAALDLATASGADA